MSPKDESRRLDLGELRHAIRDGVERAREVRALRADELRAISGGSIIKIEDFIVGYHKPDPPSI